MASIKHYLLIVFLCGIFEKIFSFGVIKDDELVVKLESPIGKIRGHILESDRGKTFYAFQQIPYAAPPINNLRFKHPQKHADWEGILNTTTQTKKCPEGWDDELVQTEDCLYLNVYTPAKPNSNKKYAVYFWIFGGGFQIGNGRISLYDPKYFMDHDVVVVTFNYRLGILGFLTTNDGIIPGNLGLWDQKFALEWVQKNIHLFGGDSRKITIGGESAGAASVSYHILSTFNKEKLFSGAIQQSGSCLNKWAHQNNPKYYAFEVGKLFDSSMKFGDSTHLLDVLLKANLSQILDAQNKIPNKEKIVGLVEDQIWLPVVEDPNYEKAFISMPMRDLFSQNLWKKVPTLIGFNSEEMLFFLPKQIKNSWELSWEEVKERARLTDKDPRNLVSDKLKLSDKEKREFGENLKNFYTNSTFLGNLQAFVKFTSDSFVIQPIIHQADIQSRNIPTYLYQFSYSARNSTFIPGVEHTEELPYFWKFGVELKTEMEKKVRHKLLKLWTNFIKYQNPTPKKIEEFNNIKWPRTNCSPNCNFLDINIDLTIRQNPRNYEQYNAIAKKIFKKGESIY